jgi:ubiquinol-cytochrome c reductase iron-sulfur subunit
MRKLLKAIWLAIVFIAGLFRRPGRRERIVPEGSPARGAELGVALLLLGAAGCAVMFVVVYTLDWANQTQWLGLCLGGALAFLSVAFFVTAKRLVVSEDVEEEYPRPGEPAEQEQLIQIVHESVGGITRKRLLKGAAGAAGLSLGAALLAPVASLGPFLDTESLYDSPWRRGRRLVDDGGRPYRARDVKQGDFYTAYPEGADPEELGSPVIMVRLNPAELDLPSARHAWAPEGIVAYSKICTHAGCAVALYRKPLFPPAEPEPAFVCPCHYSTFNPATGGTVIFGPAGRPLPQLPLLIDGKGNLRAAGNFSAPVGPSFWGVRTRRPRST